MYVVLEWICQIWTSSVKRNFGTSVWMVLYDLHDISAFGYFGRQIVVVVEGECSKPAENQPTLITNRRQETLVLTQNTQNNGKITIFWKASLLTLKNAFFYLTSSLHHPASLYREASICEEESLRYSFRTEVQPRSHRLTDLWPFASKSNTHLLFTVHVSNME